MKTAKRKPSCPKPEAAGSSADSCPAAALMRQAERLIPVHERHEEKAIAGALAASSDRPGAAIATALARTQKINTLLLRRDVFLQISLGEVAERANLPRGGLCDTRNDVCLACEAIRFLQKDKGSELSKQDVAVLGDYKKSLNKTPKPPPSLRGGAVADCDQGVRSGEAKSA
jgi:hypothetical protein